MTKRVIWMGCGALGSNAVVLCRSLKAEHVLVDDDKVESKNLAAQAFTKQVLGKNKAGALAGQLFNSWSTKATSRPVRCTAENVAQLCSGADLIVDCFDNLRSREVLSAFVRSEIERRQRHAEDDDWNAHTALNIASRGGTPYAVHLVHAALAGSGDFGLVRWDERFVADQEGAEGQATCEGGEFLPFIGLLSACLAGVVQEFLTTGTKRDLMVTRSAVNTTCTSSTKKT